jgi:hypothetical protein
LQRLFSTEKEKAMFDERLLVDFKTMKILGWPYSRSHTMRLVKKGLVPEPARPMAPLGKRERVVWFWRDVKHFFIKKPE